jgi:repressor LexA
MYKAGHDGVAPSIREIGEACGIPSTSNVKYYLEMLEDEGVIHMDAKSGRTIQVVGGQWVRPEGLGG